MPKKKAPKKSVDFLKLSIEEQVRRIDEAFTGEIYEGLKSHGGGLEIMDIEGPNVMIRYYGACGGCSLGTGTTLSFIEQTLRTRVDSRLRVVVV